MTAHTKNTGGGTPDGEPAAAPRPEPDDLIDPAEQAALLDLARISTLRDYAYRHPDFPPAWRKYGRAFRSRSALQAWKASRPGRIGRPPANPSDGTHGHHGERGA